MYLAVSTNDHSDLCSLLPPLRSNILRPFLGIWDFQLPFVTELTPGINPAEIIQSPLPALFPAHLHLIKMKLICLNPNIGINAYF